MAFQSIFKLSVVLLVRQCAGAVSSPELNTEFVDVTNQFQHLTVSTHESTARALKGIKKEGSSVWGGDYKRTLDLFRQTEQIIQKLVGETITNVQTSQDPNTALRDRFIILNDFITIVHHIVDNLTFLVDAMSNRNGRVVDSKIQEPEHENFKDLTMQWKRVSIGLRVTATKYAKLIGEKTSFPPLKQQPQVASSVVDGAAPGGPSVPSPIYEEVMAIVNQIPPLIRKQHTLFEWMADKFGEEGKKVWGLHYKETAKFFSGALDFLSMYVRTLKKLSLGDDFVKGIDSHLLLMSDFLDRCKVPLSTFAPNESVKSRMSAEAYERTNEISKAWLSLIEQLQELKARVGATTTPSPTDKAFAQMKLLLSQHPAKDSVVIMSAEMRAEIVQVLNQVPALLRAHHSAFQWIAEKFGEEGKKVWGSQHREISGYLARVLGILEIAVDSLPDISFQADIVTDMNAILTLSQNVLEESKFAVACFSPTTESLSQMRLPAFQRVTNVVMPWITLREKLVDFQTRLGIEPSSPANPLAVDPQMLAQAKLLFETNTLEQEQLTEPPIVVEEKQIGQSENEASDPESTVSSVDSLKPEEQEDRMLDPSDSIEIHDIRNSKDTEEKPGGTEAMTPQDVQDPEKKPLVSEARIQEEQSPQEGQDSEEKPVGTEAMIQDAQDPEKKPLDTEVMIQGEQAPQDKKDQLSDRNPKVTAHVDVKRKIASNDINVSQDEYGSVQTVPSLIQQADHVVEKSSVDDVHSSSEQSEHVPSKNIRGATRNLPREEPEKKGKWIDIVRKSVERRQTTTTTATTTQEPEGVRMMKRVPLESLFVKFGRKKATKAPETTTSSPTTDRPITTSEPEEVVIIEKSERESNDNDVEKTIISSSSYAVDSVLSETSEEHREDSVQEEIECALEEANAQDNGEVIMQTVYPAFVFNRPIAEQFAFSLCSSTVLTKCQVHQLREICSMVAKAAPDGRTGELAEAFQHKLDRAMTALEKLHEKSYEMWEHLQNHSGAFTLINPNYSLPQ
jgi:hypothetical protein